MFGRTVKTLLGLAGSTAVAGAIALGSAGAAGAATPVTFTFLHSGAQSSVAYSHGSVNLTTGAGSTDNAQIQLNNVAGSIAGDTEPTIAATNLPPAAGHEVVLYLATVNGNHTVFGYPYAPDSTCAAPDAAGWCWSIDGNTYGATWIQVLDHVTIGGGLKSAVLSLDQWVTSGASSAITKFSWNGQNLLPASVTVPCYTYERVSACNAATGALTANGAPANMSVAWTPPLNQRLPGLVYNIKPGSTSVPLGTTVLAGSSFSERDGVRVHNSRLALAGSFGPDVHYRT